MSDVLPDPPRWKQATGQANRAERSAGEAVRAWAEPEPLSQAQLALIAARIRASRPRRIPRLAPVIAALLLGAATAASAAHLHWLPSWLDGGRTGALLGTPHGSSSIHTIRKPHTGPAPTVAPTASEAAVTTTVGTDPMPTAGSAPLGPPPSDPGDTTAAATSVPLRKPAHVDRSEQLARPQAPLVAAPTGEAPSRAATVAPASAPTITRPPERHVAWLAPEATRPSPSAPITSGTWPAGAAAGPAYPGRGGKHLAEAIRLLRSQHDSKSALAVLDLHAADLAEQGLGHEALILRVEALLALDHRAEALRLLDGASLADGAASHALLVTRGTLRAAANRCPDGIGDFSLVLAESRADRQALMGRALCRKQLGDLDGARADLERYRRDFPGDKHLPELEQRLQVPR